MSVSFSLRICTALFVSCLASCARDAEQFSDPMLESDVGTATISQDRLNPGLPNRREVIQPFVSWQEFSERQVATDRHFLAQLDRRYFGAMGYESPEELEFMLRSGFPTAEEWLVAMAMTDDELLKQADNGDRKSAGMLADRMAVRYADLLRANAEQPGLVSDSERAKAAAMAVNYAHAASEGSAGAFGILVHGRVKATIFDTPEPMTAAMLEAYRRGDPRSERLFEEMSRAHPRQDVSIIFSALNNL